jgi:hypothetical protein
MSYDSSFQGRRTEAGSGEGLPEGGAAEDVQQYDRRTRRT